MKRTNKVIFIFILEDSGNENNQQGILENSGSKNKSKIGNGNLGNVGKILQTYKKCLGIRTSLQKKNYCKEEFQGLPGLKKKCEVIVPIKLG